MRKLRRPRKQLYFLTESGTSCICLYSCDLPHHSSFSIPHSLFLVLHSLFFILHSSFLVLHSLFLVLHSSFFVLHSSFLIPRSSFFPNIYIMCLLFFSWSVSVIWFFLQLLSTFSSKHLEGCWILYTFALAFRKYFGWWIKKFVLWKDLHRQK